jgi:peroxiredoxin
MLLVGFTWSISSGAYQVGDRVDDFVLEDVDGISHSLYDYEGKLFVLNFWASW